MAWTAFPTWVVGQVSTASDWNTYVAANMAFLAGTAGATVAAQQSTASATYTDLPSVGPAVTVTTGGNAVVLLGCGQITANNVDVNAFMSYAVSGATTVGASDATAILFQYAGGAENSLGMGTANLQTGLTPGSNTFTAKYRASGSAGFFAYRNIIVIPLP